MDEPEVNGQVVPAILRKHFPNDTEKMRALLADPSVKGDGTGGGKRKELWERGLEIASDATIKRKVEMNRLPDMAARSMHTDPHWAAASQFRTSNKDSVETPHDRVHVYCEYPMMSLMHAAFYPGFWCAATRDSPRNSPRTSPRNSPRATLRRAASSSRCRLHHCNIDRLYEAYLQKNGLDACETEFENNQDLSTRNRMTRVTARGRGREVDRFDQWLEPFYLPGADGKMTKTQFKPEHTFDTKALGYEYDVLHPTPKQNLRQMPYLALFKQVDIATLPTSYQTYIYVYKEGDAAEPPVGPDAETCLAHPNLAAIGSIFAGKGADCANCQARAAAATRPPSPPTTPRSLPPTCYNRHGHAPTGRADELVARVEELESENGRLDALLKIY